jgi:hypothetical protein
LKLHSFFVNPALTVMATVQARPSPLAVDAATRIEALMAINAVVVRFRPRTEAAAEDGRKSAGIDQPLGTDDDQGKL